MNKTVEKLLDRMSINKADKAKAGLLPSQIQRTGGSETVPGIDPFWFSALQPTVPTAPVSLRPRMWPFIPGFNKVWIPREEGGTDGMYGEGRVPFDLLYRCANEWDLFSTAMETVIDKVTTLPWQIRAKGNDEDKQSKFQQNESDPIADKLTALFSAPCRVGGMDTWRGFANKLLTDMVIGDCATIWLEKNLVGQIISFTPISGATIKVLIDDTGRRPNTVDPETGLKAAAFQQVQYGLPALDFTEDELIYAVRKPRNNTPYGRSHLEQILTWANIGIRSQRFLLAYYTSGNTPEMLIGVPATIPTQQIEQWNTVFDSYMEGQDAERRKIKMVPSLDDTGKINAVFPKEPLLKTDLDEWLARIVCFTLGLNPQAFVKSMNRASSEQAQDTAQAEGQQPIIDWMEEVMNECIKRLGYGDTHEFTFRVHREQDGLKQAQIDTLYLKTGVFSVNMVLQDLGMDTIDEDWADNHYVETPQGAVPFDSIDEMADANIAKLKQPPPKPQAPGANQQAVANKPPSNASKVDAIEKAFHEVLSLVKAHHPDAKEAATKLESKLARRLKTIEKEIAARIKAELD